MHRAGTTRTPTLNNPVRQCAGCGGMKHQRVAVFAQLLAEVLGRTKKLPYPAPLMSMCRIRCLIILVAFASLVFGDFPAGRPAELRRCLFLGPDDAPAKRGLDQLPELAIESLRFHRLEFFAALRRGLSAPRQGGSDTNGHRFA